MGDVSPQGSQGLVQSELTGYDRKSKVLGKGGDSRFHAYFKGEILYFPGLKTEH